MDDLDLYLVVRELFKRLLYSLHRTLNVRLYNDRKLLDVALLYLTEEVVEVPIEAINVPKDKVLRIFPPKIGVKFVIGVNQLRHMPKDEVTKALLPNGFRIYVDYKEIERSGSDHCHVYIGATPPNVRKPMPVTDEEFILGGDRLVYAGQINDLLELKRTHGLVAATHHVYNISEIDTNRKLRTAYVTFGSQLIGTSMTTNDFELKNDMVLVAVARQGKRVDGQPREIKLQAGDSLLLECPPKSDDQLENINQRNLTFFDSHFVPQMGGRTITAAAILVLMFSTYFFHMAGMICSCRRLWIPVASNSRMTS